MGQEMNLNGEGRGKDATGSPHNPNDLKNRAGAKFADRKDVNPLISGKGIGKARASATK
jgi:hypothetical protein